MPNPNQVHTIYQKRDGTRVPSVTTYLGILGKPAIIHWAWSLGVQGLDYRKVRDQAGDIGTLVHYLILSALKNTEPDLSDYSQNDITATTIPMGKFSVWREEHVLEPILLETPLVSEYFSFGGTPDFYGKVDNRLVLLDFKTSGDIYAENFYQLAAYKKMLEEQGCPVESARIIRISKIIDENFDDRPAGNLDLHWEIFLACQKIYELVKLTRRQKKEVE